MICENCQCEHDGLYASGRFCGYKCARGFSTKNNRDEISKKRSITSKTSTKVMLANSNRKLLRELRLCPICGTQFLFKLGSNQLKERNRKYCSQYCLTQSEEYREQARKNTIHAYNNGKKVYGGKTKWIPYKNIKVQGTYEFRTCHILDDWKSRGIIKDWSYCTDRFDYIGVDGNKHKYLVDFKIYNYDDTFYYLETKGWIKPNDPLKWESIRNKNIRLDVWFKADIEKHEQPL